MPVVSLNHYAEGIGWVPDATPKVGTVVYMNGGPQRLGRVVAVVKLQDRFRYLPWEATVQWANGERTTEPAHVLNVFQTLIDDHEKKLAGHRKRLAEFEKKFPKEE